MTEFYREPERDRRGPRIKGELPMTTLHLADQKFTQAPIIVRRRPMDRVPVVTPKDAEVAPPRGMNIFSLARVICKRATSEEPARKIAA